jgi:hypothetical protein
LRDGDGFDAMRLRETVGDFFEGAGAARGENEIVAVTREAFGEIDADAGGGARHQSCLAFARFTPRHPVSPLPDATLGACGSASKLRAGLC